MILALFLLFCALVFRYVQIVFLKAFEEGVVPPPVISLVHSGTYGGIIAYRIVTYRTIPYRYLVREVASYDVYPIGIVLGTVEFHFIIISILFQYGY